MIRSLLFDIMLFLMPFALYGIYLVIAQKSADDAAIGRPHPWVALFFAGLVLAVAGLIYLGLRDRPPAAPDAYHPHWDIPKRTQHE